MTGIDAREGEYVRKGDILLDIDPSVDKVGLEGKDRNLKFSRLAMDRGDAVITGQDSNLSPVSYPQEAVAGRDRRPGGKSLPGKNERQDE